MEPTTGLEPVNLFLTKEVLYQLSYVGSTCEAFWGTDHGHPERSSTNEAIPFRRPGSWQGA